MRKIVNSIKKQRLIVGQEYVFTEIKDVGSGKRLKTRNVVRCVGVYPHHAQFDFGKYKRSLTWFDIWQQIKGL